MREFFFLRSQSSRAQVGGSRDAQKVGEFEQKGGVWLWEKCVGKVLKWKERFGRMSAVCHSFNPLPPRDIPSLIAWEFFRSGINFK
jgi:hypothetical protein